MVIIDKLKLNKDPRYQWLEGETHPLFKIDAQYETIHRYIRRRKIRPDFCPQCNRTNCRIELSFNHSLGNPTRNPNDYIYLCCFCHQKRDKKEFGITTGTKQKYNNIQKDIIKIIKNNPSNLMTIFKNLQKNNLYKTINYCYVGTFLKKIIKENNNIKKNRKKIYYFIEK